VPWVHANPLGGGGFFVWVAWAAADSTTADPAAARESEEAALVAAARGKVLFVPGSRCRVPGSKGGPAARLCFAQLGEDEISEAGQALVAAWAAAFLVSGPRPCL
jgi:DNA-binding transcriptional MocR family regulator